jgi:hypothetical protein
MQNKARKKIEKLEKCLKMKAKREFVDVKPDVRKNNFHHIVRIDHLTL